MSPRVHLFGASGAGTSTLGRVLAARLGVLHLDADDFYWLESDPPFLEKRAPAARVDLIRERIGGHDAWVLSGSICSWGDPLLNLFTHAIFLYLPPRQRMARLRAREAARYGARIEPGGDMHAQHQAFMEWASGYDLGKAPLRSLDLHERWMSDLHCPVIRLRSEAPAARLAETVVARIAD